MALPFFYTENYDPVTQEIVLNEDASRHIIQVLRMKKTEPINLTDGKGNLLNCVIEDAHKKHCIVSIQSKIQIPKAKRHVSIGISLLKNASRFEWFWKKQPR